MSDSELALLALLAESKVASGYALAATARARGMERWAGLSASSVYKGLRRLERVGLVRSGANHKKRGKGPPGRVHTVTATGAKALRRQLAEGLEGAPEQSTRYRLALAFVELTGAGQAVKRLQQRSRYLERRIADVERARASSDKRSLGATLLFTYVLDSLEHERAATATLVRLIRTWRHP